MRAILMLLALSLGSCTENFNFLGTGGSGNGGPLEAAITSVTISPSQFEMSNGVTVTAEVRAFAGNFEITDFAFTANVSPNQSVATIVSTSRTVITLKAENPGSTNLVVTIRPGIQAVAPIRVIAAD